MNQDPLSSGSGARERAQIDLQATSRWPKWLRRGRMEMLACICIGLGILMLLQPFFMVLFTWSFVTTLFGTVMFMIVSKFPE